MPGREATSLPVATRIFWALYWITFPSSFVTVTSFGPVILPNPRKVPDLMSEFMAWLHSSTQNPIELAALAHYKFVAIHPFVDGNGRTARLFMNLILMIYGYPPAIIRPEDRLEYIKSLETAQMGGALDKYMALISRAVDRSLDIYL